MLKIANELDKATFFLQKYSFVANHPGSYIILPWDQVLEIKEYWKEQNSQRRLGDLFLESFQTDLLFGKKIVCKHGA